jgi:hypothetical protein
MLFHGALLRRGFWLYVWEIRNGSEMVYYVGRTGDSSSRNASSPFTRVGMHFDIRPKSTANSLIRRLREKGFDPTRCSYYMLAVGPLFSEQPDFERHRPIRDTVATLEHQLATHLKSRGLEVLGVHHAAAPLDRRLFAKVRGIVDARLFSSARPLTARSSPTRARAARAGLSVEL